MLCANPYVKAPNGIDERAFNTSDQARAAVTPFPCGRCLPCRINKSREWKHRIMLESYPNSENLFVTLTYDEENIPPDSSVQKSDIQKYLKRLRKEIGQFRYFVVGEYGDQSWRPHYHLALFGVSPLMAYYLKEKWGKGQIHIGEISEQSAEYIAGYAIKKLTRDDDRRLITADDDLNQYLRKPEFMTSSRLKGGIGKPAIEILADKLNNNKFWKPKVVRELQYGKKRLPLGRYLTDKLATLTNVPAELRAKELQDYQSQIYIENMTGDSFFMDNFIKSNSQRRLNQFKRYQIFKKGKKI